MVTKKKVSTSKVVKAAKPKKTLKRNIAEEAERA
jgi:hypothetical protein